MKLNGNTVIYGNHVALLPYTPDHVAIHHHWMQDPENRLSPDDPAPTVEAQAKQHKRLWASSKLPRCEDCVFLVGNAEILKDGTGEGALIGEVQLVFGGGKDTAMLELLIVGVLGFTGWLSDDDRSVRRKTFISEALLLMLHYGVTALHVRKFVVAPEQPSQNRLMFASRDEAKASASAGNVKASKPRRKSSITGLLKKVFKKEKTNYLQKLTRHLRKEDEGEHWPEELDFVLVDYNRLELDITKEGKQVLKDSIFHGKFIKHSCMLPDLVLRTSTNTRVNGRSLSLVPYRPEHIPMCHRFMQDQSMYVAFGVMPPSIEEETEAQKQMCLDPDCYAFVACQQDRPGAHDCVATVVGRAQVLYHAGVARVHIGISVSDMALRKDLSKELLCMCLSFAYAVLPVVRIVVPFVAAIRPAKTDPPHVHAILTWKESAEDPDDLDLTLGKKATRAALEDMSRFARLALFSEDDMVYTSSEAV